MRWPVECRSGVVAGWAYYRRSLVRVAVFQAAPASHVAQTEGKR